MIVGYFFLWLAIAGIGAFFIVISAESQEDAAIKVVLWAAVAGLLVGGIAT